IDGAIRIGNAIRPMASGTTYEVDQVAVFRPALVPVDCPRSGGVVFVPDSIKNVKDARVGDTITSAHKPAAQPLPGYRPAVPMVYCGLYPVDNEEFRELRDALEKLQLNDASLVFEPESSAALGFGFRCGF